MLKRNLIIVLVLSVIDCQFSVGYITNLFVCLLYCNRGSVHLCTIQINIDIVWFICSKNFYYPMYDGMGWVYSLLLL